MADESLELLNAMAKVERPPWEKKFTGVISFYPTSLLTISDDVKNKFLEDLQAHLASALMMENLIVTGNLSCRVDTARATLKEVNLARNLRLRHQWLSPATPHRTQSCLDQRLPPASAEHRLFLNNTPFRLSIR
nr:unnamed protein product [Spirometra erinaceieuropaei]